MDATYQLSEANRATPVAVKECEEGTQTFNPASASKPQQGVVKCMTQPITIGAVNMHENFATSGLNFVGIKRRREQH
jgi:hypothetical protein